MNLNNISLPSQLVADLYQHALIEGTTTAMPPKQQVPSLGKAGKGILIVVNKPDVPFLPDSELDFLTKVLTACQLSLADVAIVNWNRLTEPDAEALVEQFGATAVILFDVAPSLFGLPTETVHYIVQATDREKFVVAPSLQKIEKSKEAKGQLWTALKQLFGI